MRKSWIIAVLIVLAAALWVASGRFVGSDAADREPEPAAAEAATPRVRVATITAEPMANALVLQGETLAERKVEVRAEVAGRVERIAVERGGRVVAGDPLVTLTLDNRDVQLEQARALLAQRQAEYDAAARLNQSGYSADLRLVEARAALDAARAAVEQAEWALERITVAAPFAGIVDSRPVELGDFVDRGQVVATVVDLDPIRVVTQVSERHLGRVAPGTVGEVRLLDGRTVPGYVSFIGSVASETTHTFPVEVSFPNRDGTVIEGLTAAVELPLDQAMAHLVSPAVLTLSDDGAIGVKAVAPDNTVVFHPVEILREAPEGYWLGGLPETLSLITVGQEFVRAGQTVLPVEAAAIAAARENAS